MNRSAVFRNLSSWLLNGLCLLSDVVCVISTCWQYLFSSSLSSYLTPLIIFTLSPSLSHIKKGWERGCQSMVHAGARLTSRGKMKKGRRTEEGSRRGDEIVQQRRLREKKEEEGTSVPLSATAQLTEKMENTMCSVCLCVLLCVILLHARCWMHLLYCLREKRSHAVRWRALFFQWDGGRLDLNTKSMFHTEEMRLLKSNYWSSNSSMAHITSSHLMSPKNTPADTI